MNERERAICARVKQFREDIKWPQPAFANELGISRNQLANVEYGRAPLRVALGVKICKAFYANGEWLATGTGLMHGGSPMITAIEYDPEWYSWLFSDAYDRSPDSFASPTIGPRYLTEEPTPGFDPQTFLLKNILRWFQINNFKNSLESENFAREVCDHAEIYLKQLRSAGAVTRSIRSEQSVHDVKNQTQATLDITPGEQYNLSVKAPIRSLPALLEAIRAKVVERGQKTALARELGVSRQAVDQWLSGDAKPSAELTFELLKWVEQQERKK